MFNLIVMKVRGKLKSCFLILFLLVLKEGRIALKNQIDYVESADTHFHALEHQFFIT
jgi:hypothetical protein